jgi:hypothetical protein
MRRLEPRPAMMLISSCDRALYVDSDVNKLRLPPGAEAFRTLQVRAPNASGADALPTRIAPPHGAGSCPAAPMTSWRDAAAVGGGAGAAATAGAAGAAASAAVAVQLAPSMVACSRPARRRFHRHSHTRNGSVPDADVVSASSHVSAAMLSRMAAVVPLESSAALQALVKDACEDTRAHALTLAVRATPCCARVHAPATSHAHLMQLISCARHAHHRHTRRTRLVRSHTAGA